VVVGVARSRVGRAQVVDDVLGLDQHPVAVDQHRHDVLSGDLAHRLAISERHRHVDVRVRQLELAQHLAYTMTVGAPLGLVEGQCHVVVTS